MVASVDNVAVAVYRVGDARKKEKLNNSLPAIEETSVTNGAYIIVHKQSTR